MVQLDVFTPPRAPASQNNPQQDAKHDENVGKNLIMRRRPFARLLSHRLRRKTKHASQKRQHDRSHSPKKLGIHISYVNKKRKLQNAELEFLPYFAFCILNSAFAQSL
jgi:hypothetical protein